MITKELLNPKNVPLTPDMNSNLERHTANIIQFEKEYIFHGGKDLVVTSGVRSPEDQVRVYGEINRKRMLDKLKPLPIPMGSRHLKADATDFQDRDKRLAAFCVQESKPGGLLEKLGLYMEEPSMTVGWVHLQSHPPASGSRIFKPYQTVGKR